WVRHMPEYTAPRFKKRLLDEDVIVFPASSLHKYLPCAGLHADRIDGAALLSECFPMRRRVAEADPSVIQLVSVFVIREGDRFLTYKRTKRLPESRLHGFYSLGFGGHLNPGDLLPLFDISDPDLGMMILERELNEEVTVPRSGMSFHYRGLLYDDSNSLSRQHLGIVNDVFVAVPEYTIGERGFLIDPKFETLAQIAARMDEFESWSAMLIRQELVVSRSRPAELEGHDAEDS
ncbi:MAG: hypothetical protein M1305_00595, partial [Candidatus Marsarchaeota archaeon]|nr:hypothetical protein [Candidatus Marsarchaeota archaeon]